MGNEEGREYAEGLDVEAEAGVTQERPAAQDGVQAVENEGLQARGERKKRRFRIPRWLFWITLLLLLALGSVLGFTMWVNHEVKTTLAERSIRLDRKELMVQWVSEDVRQYLMVKNEADYKASKAEMHVTRDYRKLLFGDKYNPMSFLAADAVRFLDIQYTLDSQGVPTDKFYILAEVTRGEKTSKMNMIVQVSNNLIYDIQTY